MKKLPDAELELMMIIWDAEGPVTRMEIEERMDEGRKCFQVRFCPFFPGWRKEAS